MHGLLKVQNHFFGCYFSQTASQATAVFGDILLFENFLSLEADVMNHIVDWLFSGWLHNYILLAVALLHQSGNHRVEDKFFGRLFFGRGVFNHEEEDGFRFGLHHHGHAEGRVHHVVKEGANVNRIHGLKSLRVQHGWSETFGGHQPLQKGICHGLLGRAAVPLQVILTNFFNFVEGFTLPGRHMVRRWERRALVEVPCYL